MCKEKIENTIQNRVNVGDKVPERFINDPDAYRIWLGFQEIVNMSKEERDLLFEDDFVGGGCH